MMVHIHHSILTNKLSTQFLDIEYDTSEGAPNKTSSEIDVVHEFVLHQTNFDQKSSYEHLKRMPPVSVLARKN